LPRCAERADQGIMADKPFHNPFASLGPLRDKLGPVEETDTRPPPAPAPKSTAQGKGTIARAVVRTERSGRGGKDVTVVEGLGLSQNELAQWLKALKGALGCGGSVESGALVLQGDHRDRLPAILEARGVRRVVRGT
jgi:translation initiation factor 1